MDRLEYISDKVSKHYQEATRLGYEVVGVFLQGSQNYELDEYSDEYMSDVDTKCIVLPTLDDLICGKKPESAVHVLINDEHIDIKDIRSVFTYFKAQNNAYIEILFTRFKCVNPKYQDLWDEVLTHAEDIARFNFNQSLRCFAGSSLEKCKVLEHPFPAAMYKINQFGYDPKQLHHILRLNDLEQKYIDGKPYSECLIPNNKEYLMSVKKGCYSLGEARALAKSVDCDTRERMTSALLPKDCVLHYINTFLNNAAAKFIKRFVVSKIKEM